MDQTTVPVHGLLGPGSSCSLWRRLSAAALLLLVSSGAALAQNVEFSKSSVFGISGDTIDFEVLTDDGKFPVGGGTFTWIVDSSCNGRVSFNNPPDTPNISGTTLVSITSQRAAFCEVSVEWDHDNDPFTQPIVPKLPLSVFFDPLFTIEVLGGPSGGLTVPIGSTVDYEFLLRDNGFAVGEAEASVELFFNSPFKDFYFGCSTPSLITDGSGIASFSFADAGLLPLQQGLYLIDVSAVDFSSGCRGDRPSRTRRAPEGVPSGISVDFFAEPASLAIVKEPKTLIVGQPAELIISMLAGQFNPLPIDGGGTPVQGKLISWSATPPALFQAPSSGDVTTNVDGEAAISLTAAATDMTGGFFQAIWNPPDGITNPVSVSTVLGITELGIQFQTTPDDNPVFTEESASGFQVFAYRNDGNTDDPVEGLTVTFNITTGNAVFLPDETTSIQVDTDSGGFASSPPIQVGRTAQDVIVEVDAGLHGSLQATYFTTPSTYLIDPVLPPDASASITLGDDIDLAVALARQGSSSPLPLAGDAVEWLISPNDGSSIITPTNSDGSGQAGTTFAPAQSGSYTITARFDPGIAGVPPADLDFVIDVAAGPALQVAKSFSFSTDNGVPGFADEGDVIEYLVTIDNIGSIAASITSVLDSLQGGAPVALAGCPVELAPGESGNCAVYSHVVTANDLQSSSIVNTVEVQADFGKPGSQTFSDTVFVPVAMPSPFTLSIVSPPGGAASIQLGNSVSLQVLAEESGSPVADGTSVDFRIVSGPAGASLFPDTATTSNGQAGTSFSATQNGSYVVEAELIVQGQPFQRGSGKQIDGFATPNPVVSFSIDVTDVVRTLNKPPFNSGDGQSGPPLNTLPQPLVVIARDDGAPAAGVTVNWAVTGDASLDTNQTSTQADGSTSVTLTFGPSTGTVQVTATRADDASAQASFVVFSVDQTLVAVSGGGQSGASGETLALPLVVEALDDGNPASGVAIEWTVVSGEAFFGANPTVTGANGRSAVSVTLGQPGPVQIQAQRMDMPAAVASFSLLSEALNETLEIVAGDGQIGTLTRDGQPLSVRFLRGGLAVAGQTVDWQVLQGDATVLPTASQSDAAGIASSVPRFGTTAGPVRVRASAGSAPPVEFELNAAAPELRLLAGGGQSGPSGTRAGQALVVGLFDACCDTPIEGADISWQVVAGDATLDTTLSTTNAAGQTENGFSFGSSGAFTIRASALGGLVSVDIQGASFIPSIVILAGDGQTGFVEQPLAQDFIVLISAPAAGAEKSFAGLTIEWQVIGGGGSLSATTTETDAQGAASTRLTLGPDVGINQVRASLVGGSSVVFSANAVLPSGNLVRISGDGQTIPTGVDSAPLVVELRDDSGAPLANRTLVWVADNAEVQNASTVTDAQGRAQNIARVLIPGAASVQVSAQQVDAAAVSFGLNGGIANIPTLNPAQRQIGRALDSACELLSALTTPLTPGQADLLARCLELAASSGDDPQGVQRALNELSNDIGAAQVNAAFDALRGQQTNIQRRLANRRTEQRGGFDISGLGLQSGTGALSLGLLASDDPQAETGADFGRWSFFASGMIGSGRQDGTGQSRGFKFESSGLTAGVDYRVNPQVFLGAAIGYNRQDADFRSDRGGMDTSGWSLTGYGSWYNDKNWYVDGVLTWGRNDYDIERNIRYNIAALGGGTTQVNQTARGSTSGDLTSFSLSAGRDFQTGAWSYGGYLRGSIARADIDAYSERISGTGPGTGLGLAVESRDFDSQTATLGGRLSYTASRDWGILTPSLQFEWEHELKDDPQRIVSRFIHDPGNTQLVVDGDPLDRDYFNVGLGLSAIFPGGRSAFVFYEQMMGRSRQSQGTLSIGVRIEF